MRLKTKNSYGIPVSLSNHSEVIRLVQALNGASTVGSYAALRLDVVVKNGTGLPRQ